MDYREVERDDPAFARLVREAFAPDRGPFDEEEHEPDEGPGEVGAPRGLYDDDELVAVCKHYWFDAEVRGRSVGAPGLSVVASPPEHRRGGNVRRLLAASLEEYRERGDAVSLLWPFSTPFYAQYGWATTNRNATFDVEPADLAFATGTDAAAAVEWRNAAPDEDGVVEAVATVDDAAWTGALSLDRGEAFWRKGVFRSWDTDPYVYVGERDGTPAAFAVYYVREDDGDGRRMYVANHGAVDHDALLGLLSFCHQHDSQVAEVRFSAPEGWPLEYALEDPGAVEVTASAGPMARVVDAASALEALEYPEVDATVVLDVDDPLVDWHDAPLRLDLAGGAATCERAPDATPDVALGVGALSQLVVGARSATALERTGDLETGSNPDEDPVRALDAAFPETEPGLVQHF